MLKPISILPFRSHFLVLAIVIACSPLAYAEDGITNIGSLGGDISYAYAVSGDGNIVVGQAYTTDDVLHAFRWSSSDGMVDLGTLGGYWSLALDSSYDGNIVVGESTTSDSFYRAFRWTQSDGMADLGTLGGDHSGATGISNDGVVIVGAAGTVDNYVHAFRWTQSSGMVDLGTLGGNESQADGLSHNGNVVVGRAETVDGYEHAFRWTQSDGMTDLGTLGGSNSYARDTSADGSVIVGFSDTVDDYHHAFRWTQSSGMVDLGTLGGTRSSASATSADGSVIVGWSYVTDDVYDSRAFRWTEATGMQSVEDWLKDNGIKVSSTISTDIATDVSDNGNVVVGWLTTGQAFIARAQNGLISLDDLYASIETAGSANIIAAHSPQLVMNGAHSNPLSKRVKNNQSCAWLAGDWGKDEHQARSGEQGLAEISGCHHFGSYQFNVSLGKSWANQNLENNGDIDLSGHYLMLEALTPVKGNLWASISSLYHHGDMDIKRGYLNAGLADNSYGSTDTHNWAIRAHFEVDNWAEFSGAVFNPYLGISYRKSRQAAYTEIGGGFPVQFDTVKSHASEVHIGLNMVKPITPKFSLNGKLEGIHLLNVHSSDISGSVIDLNSFSFSVPDEKESWLRAGAGMSYSIGDGIFNLMLNVTTEGQAPSTWLAASYQVAF